jgi:preprotein translocase subunit SecF
LLGDDIVDSVVTPKQGFFDKLKVFYQFHQKKLLYITVGILLLAIIQIIAQYALTGEPFQKDISLKGGLSITVPLTAQVSADNVQERLVTQFPKGDISVRSLSRAGTQIGLIIYATDVDEKQFVSSLEGILNIKSKDFSIEVMGSALGNSFFIETFRAIFVAFLCMALVVFLYFGEGTRIKIISAIITFASGVLLLFYQHFVLWSIGIIGGFVVIFLYYKNSIPSVAVILCAFSDIVITLAVVNLLGMKISTAGLAAFLMLIGYSVDTDILLTTSVLKNKEGSILDNTFIAMKTGLTMSLTALVAMLAGLLLSPSPVINQIMAILVIGLCVDIIFTWVQNAAILRLYLERKRREKEERVTVDVA